MYKLPERRGGGGGGNSGNARKKTFFFSGGVPLPKANGHVTEWIRHQTLNLGIVGLSPITVDFFLLVIKLQHGLLLLVGVSTQTGGMDKQDRVA